MSYSSPMSCLNPGPTSHLRWMVRHRKGFRVGAVLLIAWSIYVLVTDGSVLGAGGGVVVSLALLFNIWYSACYVENYDNARGQGPNSD